MITGTHGPLPTEQVVTSQDGCGHEPVLLQASGCGMVAHETGTSYMIQRRCVYVYLHIQCYCVCVCEGVYDVHLKEKSTALFKSVHVCLYEPLLKHMFLFFSFCSRQLIPKSIHSMFVHMTEMGVVSPSGI